MTLILAVGNRENMIQLSDRRLSCDGKIIDDESNKVGVLVCRNARLAFGFTGLARYGSFKTYDWLLDTIYESGTPEFTAYEILCRVTEKATFSFSNHPTLKKIPKEHKRLTILFSGYLYHHNPPKMAFATITNFQNFAEQKDDTEAWDHFIADYKLEKKDTGNDSRLFFGVGNYSVVEKSDVEVITKMLIEKKPGHAVVEKTVELIRELSDRKKSGGTIGKQITSIILPMDPQKSFDSNYHSNVNRSNTYMADTVFLLGPKNSFALKAFTIPSEVVPKTKRDHPCPCKSGKKYKDCHGRRISKKILRKNEKKARENLEKLRAHRSKEHKLPPPDKID